MEVGVLAMLNVMVYETHLAIGGTDRVRQGVLSQLRGGREEKLRNGVKNVSANVVKQRPLTSDQLETLACRPATALTGNTGNDRRGKL